MCFQDCVCCKKNILKNSFFCGVKVWFRFYWVLGNYFFYVILWLSFFIFCFFIVNCYGGGCYYN